MPVLSDLVSLQYVRPERTSTSCWSATATITTRSGPIPTLRQHPRRRLPGGDAIEKFTHRFPALTGRPACSSSYAGCYDVTPDYNPVIGPAPIEGLYLCAGFSGHGYKISPAVGELMADLLCEGASRHPDIDGDDFRFERFARDELLTSPHPYAGAAEMR